MDVVLKLAVGVTKMPEITKEMIYIPFPKALYDDVVRLSDGSLDPVSLAEERVLSLIETNLDGLAWDWFGNRIVEFAEIYFPKQAERLKRLSAGDDEGFIDQKGALIWKEIEVPPGTEVRMQYQGVSYFARIVDGAIQDKDGRFTPSEWASKVASGTSRNAWRDLSFKRFGESHWTPAEILRAAAKRRAEEVSKILSGEQ